MIRCLEVPEILLEIFEPVFAAKNGYPDLAGLARTCRAFYKPAISVFWRTQSSVLPLVHCFPSEVLDLSGGDRGQPKTVVCLLPTFPEILVAHWQGRYSLQKFVRLPSFQDWERPLIYAKLITAIATDSSCSSWRTETHVLHTSVVQTFLDPCPALPLLPRLRYLDHFCISSVPRATSIDARVALEMACLFKVPSLSVLRSLRLQFPIGGGTDTAVFLAQFAEHFATIESLHIHIGNPTLIYRFIYSNTSFRRQHSRVF